MHLSVTTTSSGMIHQSICLNLPMQDIYADIVKQFELEFVGEKCIVLSHHKFWNYECSEEQCFDDYATELCPLADACEFVEQENMIRDKIVFSMKDKCIQEHLLREVKLTLNRAEDM